MNQRVRSPEPARTQDGARAETTPTTPGQDRLRIAPNPNLAQRKMLEAVGANRTVLPLQPGQSAPLGSMRAGQFQQVDAMRAQALGVHGAARRFDESSGAPYYEALQAARELDSARRGGDLGRVAKILESRSFEEIGNIRSVWKAKMGPESLDIALKNAFPKDADRINRLLRGRPTRA